MRKFKLIIFFVIFITSAAKASLSVNACIIPKEDDRVFNIGHGVKISYENFLTLTPKSYTQLTGHHLGLIESLALKAIQKKIKKLPYYANGEKSQITAAILAVLLGGLGVHRFYLGYTWQGIVQILTLGGLGIWSLIDTIRIFTGNLKPKNGEYDKTF